VKKYEIRKDRKS